jgi:hypothetical protein
MPVVFAVLSAVLVVLLGIPFERDAVGARNVVHGIAALNS